MNESILNCNCGCNRCMFKNMLSIYNCQSITEPPNIIGLDELTFVNCRNISTIDTFPNIKKLYIFNNPSLIYIDNILNLSTLVVHTCAQLKSISNIPNLKELKIWNCFSLFNIHINTEFKNNNIIIEIARCPFLNHSKNPDFNSNIIKLKRIQKYIKKNISYRIFKQWIKSKSFAEWFYHPDNFGGKYNKRMLKRLLQ